MNTQEIKNALFDNIECFATGDSVPVSLVKQIHTEDTDKLDSLYETLMSIHEISVKSNGEITPIVRQFFKDGKTFTGFDVTKQLRKNGRHIRHNNLRDIINQVIKVEMPPTYTSRVDGDHMVYEPAVTVTTVSVIPKQSRTVTFTPPSNGVVFKPDNGGKLTIRNKFTRKAGFVHGDTVYAVNKNNQVVLTKNPTGSKLTSYKVDYHDNLRPVIATLNKVLNNKSSYEVSVNNNEIVIK